MKLKVEKMRQGISWQGNGKVAEVVKFKLTKN